MKRTARNVSIKHLLLLSLLTPAVCGLLHVLTPGGVVGSHLTVLTVAALVLSLAHTLLLYPTHRPRFGAIAGVVLASTAVFYILAILFGAHATRETLAWSVFLTSLSTLPATLLLKSDAQNWIRVFVHNRFNTDQERYVFLSCLATLLGAWLGAFPILLDWNRALQEWPIPCSVGAVLGHTAGVLGYLLLVSDSSMTILYEQKFGINNNAQSYIYRYYIIK